MQMGQYAPGTASFDQLNLQGVGINVINGPIRAVAGVVGSKAWLYQYLEPAHAVAASVGGRCSATFQSGMLESGTVYQAAIPIEAGLNICRVTLCSVAAQTDGSHAWVGLADNTNKVLTISTDNTATSYFAADTLVTTSVPVITTAYTGLYYLFVCVVAGTTPTFASVAAPVSPALSNANPVLCGTSLTGQTDPVAVGSSLGVITPVAGYQLYGYLT